MDMRIEVQRSDFRQALAVPDPDAASARVLEPGQARLHVAMFALTANNVTYAAFGDAMKYWQFFPSAAPQRGVVPVWGFGEVVESRAEGLVVGERVYGFFPMGSHLVVEPGRVGGDGFVDLAPHRVELPAIYNRYQRSGAGGPDLEARQALLQPLFATAFLIDDFLAGERFFGAKQVVFSSASSKTAWCTAFCLALRPAAERPRIVGLTSTRHVGSTSALGCYDDVLAYDGLDALDAAATTVYVDMAGDAGLRQRIHRRWGDRLAHSAAVGGTHWTTLGGAAALPGPRPVLFFAPSQAARRAAPAPEGWGPDGLRDRMAAAWLRIGQWLDARADGGLKVDRAHGVQASLDAWGRLVAGQVGPELGLIRSI